jgi:hypothetical protein
LPLTRVTWNQGRELQTATPETVLELAQGDPFFPYPAPILRAILDQPPRPAGVSVTSLLYGCLRCEVLKKHEPFTENLDDMMARFRGTAMHKVLEDHSHPDDVVEVRFHAALPDGLGELHGQPDVIHVNGVAYGVWDLSILDLKTTKNAPRWGNPWSHHVEQLMVYKWLVEHAHDAEGSVPWAGQRVQVSSVGVWYVDKEDTPKVMPVTTSRQVATKPGARNPYKTVKEQSVWSDEEVLALVIPRYREYTAAMSAYAKDKTLPPYPPGFDFIRHWAHRFSPVAELCVSRHIEERTQQK